ncbi:MYND Zn-finger protein [Ceratobasidium sp. AG-Ba]|nr:MYND Zn-finger protein [Ceratobasidium sp. AG-Ba]
MISQPSLSKNESNILPGRSAGAFVLNAATPVNNLFKRCSETGSVPDVDDAKNLNPTFVYSSSGGRFNLDLATFPQGFHLLPAMTPTSISSELGLKGAIVKIMKQQFADWARAFRTSRAADSIKLRFYAGDAIGFCHALDLYSRSGNIVPGLYVSE